MKHKLLPSDEPVKGAVSLENALYSPAIPYPGNGQC